jgi:hypothetical protein
LCIAFENNYIAGKDAVRISDFFPVHPPDFRPPPGFLEEFPGNPPQGVAWHDDMAVGGAIGQLEVLSGWRRRAH